MKQTRSSVHALCACILLATACSAKGPSDPLGDPNSFAGMNSLKVQYDCEQTRVCLDTRSMKPAGDFTTTCIMMAAAKLDGSPEMQPGFLSTVNRCGSFSGCDYLDCTMRHPTGYGETQMAKIIYACQQFEQCAVDQKRSKGDPTQAVNNCVGMAVGMLFNYSTTQRTNFENTFATCSALASCDFLQCFPF
jgi:hypothetical protein